ncbi:MAG: phosphatidate cytidylyltransferase [Acidobacteriota bacterium]
MADGAPQSRSKRFARELTALIGAPILVWLIGWAPSYAYTIMIAVICSLALFEFLVLGEKKGYPVQKVLSILLLLFLLSAFLLKTVSVEMGVFAILLILPAFYVFSHSSVDAALPASAVCVLGTLYIGMLGGALLRLRLDFGAAGPKLIFFLCVAVWAADAGAYYVGRRYGKTKLSPRVSPKKTVEGLVGGVVISLLAAAIVHFTFFPELPLLHALVAAMILAVAGVIGDLAESMWKRSADVKDSGTFLPGHGGFLDRMDSVLFTAPLLYSYWFLYVHHFRLI